MIEIYPLLFAKRIETQTICVEKHFSNSTRIIFYCRKCFNVGACTQTIFSAIVDAPSSIAENVYIGVNLSQMRKH